MQFISVAALLVVAAILGVIAARVFPAVSRVRDTDSRLVRDLSPGFYGVQGRIKALGHALESPHNRLPCVYYRLRVTEYRQQQESPSWVQVVDDVAGSIVAIDDGTGQVEVDLALADVDVAGAQRTHSEAWDHAPPALEAALRQRYGGDQRLLFNLPIRIDERVLHDGDELFVMGAVIAAEDGKLRIGRVGGALVASDGGRNQMLEVVQWRVFRNVFATVVVIALVVATLVRAL